MTSDLLPEVTPVEFMVSPSFLVLLNTPFMSVLWTIIKGFAATGFILGNIKHKEIRGSMDMLMNGKTGRTANMAVGGRGNSAAFKYTTQPARLELLPGEGGHGGKKVRKVKKKNVLRTTQTDEEQGKKGRVEAARVERELEDVGRGSTWFF